jgi:hypothetical protein
MLACIIFVGIFDAREFSLYYSTLYTVIFSCVVPGKIKIIKATKGLIAFTLEIDCNQTAMGLPPITSAVLLIAK